MMMKILSLVLLLVVVPVQAETFTSIAKEVRALYTPVNQGSFDEFIWHSGHEPFAGDCDDYATAMIMRLYAAGIEYQTWFTKPRKGGRAVPHVVVCSNMRCSDSYDSRAVFRKRPGSGKWKRIRLEGDPSYAG